MVTCHLYVRATGFLQFGGGTDGLGVFPVAEVRGKCRYLLHGGRGPELFLREATGFQFRIADPGVGF